MMHSTTAGHRRARSWGLGFLLSFMLGSIGCMGHLHPIRPSNDLVVPNLPCACRSHVYVFFVHGIDPLDYANLSGLRQHCHALGYTNTWYGQLYHGQHFLAELRRIRALDPEARFVLIGFSAGANVIRGLANELADENTSIDLMIYMGGNTLKDVPASKPANVGKVIHILATGYVWKGYPIAGAENYKYAGAWHFDSPSHPETLKVVAHELAMVASRVAILQPKPPAANEEELGPPTPRVVVPVASARRDDWDFLKPTNELRSLPDRNTLLAIKSSQQPSEQPDRTLPPQNLIGRPVSRPVQRSK